MKKTCAFVLVLCLVLTLLAVPVVLVPASAESISIGADDTTVTADGVTYNVLRTAEDFKAITGNNNYIFANDIDLAGAVIDGSNASLIKGFVQAKVGHDGGDYGVIGQLAQVLEIASIKIHNMIAGDNISVLIHSQAFFYCLNI